MDTDLLDQDEHSKAEATAPAASQTSQTLQADAPRRRVFIKSYGCQMNVYDAVRMGDVLEPEGYTEASAPEDADLVILNTCHIRERASEKVFSELGKLRQLKIERAGSDKPLAIAVAGCVAQAEGDEILRRQKAVDLVVGPQNYHRLPDLVRQARERGRVVDTEFPVESKFDHMNAPSPARVRRQGVSAFVTVQEGCDKFCAFCVVPFTRGAETSRPVRSILQEIDHLARAGVREVTLIGQNVNAYHGLDDDGAVVGLAGLVARIAAMSDILRIRYTTSHPRDMDDALIAAHRDEPKLAPFLHLPVQSGSDRILAAMNRKHRAQDYVDLVARIRAARPDIALSSDFIVGFPGESEQDFRDTLALIETVDFATTFSFKYSPRPGTGAADAPDQIAEDVKADRLARLQELVERQRRAFNRGTVGRVVDVLFEKTGRHAGQIVGKTDWLQTVQVDAPTTLIGAMARVEIVEAGPNSLFGRIVDELAQHSLHQAGRRAL